MVKRCKILFLAIVSYFGTVGYLDAAGVRNYTAVTNVSFHNLTYIPSNFLYHAFGESENYYEGNIPELPTVQRVDFHSVIGFNPYAQGDYGIMGFGICTNLRYAAFDSLQSGVVNLDDVTAPLVVSASNIASSAVIDVSDCTNLRDIRFDTVPSIITYDSRWIPKNADFRVFVPQSYLQTWRNATGWKNYKYNIVRAGMVSPIEFGYTYYMGSAGSCQVIFYANLFDVDLEDEYNKWKLYVLKKSTSSKFTLWYSEYKSQYAKPYLFKTSQYSNISGECVVVFEIGGRQYYGESFTVR